MFGFYTFPHNMLEDQTGNAKIVSDRNINTSVAITTPITIQIAIDNKPFDTMFVISEGLTSINTLTANTSDSDETYYLKQINNKQYTLHKFAAAVSADPYGIEFTGSGGKVYRVLLMKKISTFNINKFFSSILPDARHRKDVVHESLIGNHSVQRRADSNKKRKIQYESRFRDNNDLNAIDNIAENYASFTFVRNTKMHYADVFPAYLEESRVSSPYSGPVWETGYSPSFTVVEQ